MAQRNGLLDAIKLSSPICGHQVRITREQPTEYAGGSVAIFYRCDSCPAWGCQVWEAQDWVDYKAPYIQSLLDLLTEGLKAQLTVEELCVALDLNKSTVIQHARKMGLALIFVRTE